MTEQEIKAEHDRLRPILFEGAPEHFKWAVMNSDGFWNFSRLSPDTDELLFWASESPFEQCKNQPETNLHWTDTLIERGDA